MSDITNNANKRTSNRVSLPTAVGSGSRIRRIGVSTYNLLGPRAINAIGDGLMGINSSIKTALFTAPDLIGQDIGNAIVSGVKWLAADPTEAKKQGYPNVLPKNYDYSRNKTILPNNFDYSTNKNAGKGNISTATDSQPVRTPIQPFPDKTYKWNLPPHKWSLPLDPSSVSNTVNPPNKDLHTNRRGIIFVGMKYNGNTKTKTSKTGAQENTGTGGYSSNYGFQFVWNPETFSQNTSVNWGITPNSNDVLAATSGLFSANSTLDFTLRIDRTNDFACAKANNLTKEYLLSSLDTNFNNVIFNQNNAAQQASLNDFAQYYVEGKAPNSDVDFAANINEKLKDLLKRGTEADLEFLYRTINGDGYTTTWGTSSSNISFLLPTLIRLDLGPQKLVGMVQSVNVTHLAFTREMIPIRTDVSLSIDLRSSFGLLTNNTKSK